MPTTFLALFAAMAYAVSAPQGRCDMPECRYAVSLGGYLYKRVVVRLNIVDRPIGRFRFN